jgi:cobalt-zinc-cadmium efflux system outer membrane protein
MEIGAGFRLIQESDDQAFVFGLSVPLAFGNRNQGGREAARIRTLQAEDERMAIQLGLQQELLDKSREVQAAYAQVMSLKNKQLPTAQKAYEEATDGYEKGLFSSLDLLDALRSLFGQELRYINAVLAYHHAQAELDNLVGESLIKNEEVGIKNLGEGQ